MANFFPPVASKSKFREDFINSEIDQVYIDFMDKYEHIVYISFGTTFSPNGL